MGRFKPHGYWYVTALRKHLQFHTNDSPRWFVRIFALRVMWWPHDSPHLDIVVGKRGMYPRTETVRS